MGAEDQLKAAQAGLTQNETLIKNAQSILANPKSTPSAISNAKRTIQAAQFNVGVYKKRVQDAFVIVAREKVVQAQKEAERQRQKEALEAQKAIQLDKELRARQQATQEQDQIARLEKKAEEERIRSQQILQMAEQVKQPDVLREEKQLLEQRELTKGITPSEIPEGLEGVKLQQEELIFGEKGYFGQPGVYESKQQEFFQGEVLRKEIPEEEGSFENIVGRFTEIQKKAQKTSEEVNYLSILKNIALQKAKTPQELEVARSLPEGEAVIIGGSAVPFPYVTTGYFEETKEYYIDPVTGKKITGTGIGEIGTLRDIGGFEAPETLAIVRSYEAQPPSLAEQLYGVAQPKKEKPVEIPTVPIRPIQPTLQQDPFSIITGAGLQPTVKGVTTEYIPTDQTKKVFAIPPASAGFIKGAETIPLLSDIGKQYGISGDLFSSITKDLTPFTQTEKEFKATQKAKKAEQRETQKTQTASEEKLLKDLGFFIDVKSTGVRQYGTYASGGFIFDQSISGLQTKKAQAIRIAELAKQEAEARKARIEAQRQAEQTSRIISGSKTTTKKQTTTKQPTTTPKPASPTPVQSKTPTKRTPPKSRPAFLYNLGEQIFGQQPKYVAKGYHGYVDKPTVFVAGEAGKERVDVTPIKKNNGIMDYDYSYGLVKTRHRKNNHNQMGFLDFDFNGGKGSKGSKKRKGGDPFEDITGGLI